MRWFLAGSILFLCNVAWAGNLGMIDTRFYNNNTDANGFLLDNSSGFLLDYPVGKLLAR